MTRLRASSAITAKKKKKIIKSTVSSKKKMVKNVKSITNLGIIPDIYTLTDLSDLLFVCKNYEKRTNTDDTNPYLDRLCVVYPYLEELESMIGLREIKKSFMHHVLYAIQGTDSMINHIVIYGSPGNGKTVLAKLFGCIFAGLKIVSEGNFITATRSDFIGEHLGSTALLTTEVMYNSFGNVLFIDEVYSLGSSEKRDSFSKECIDTINLFLTEHCHDFICIIAGYEKDIKECFFDVNSGLERRFPWKYRIPSYDMNDLKRVFEKQARDSSFSLKNAREALDRIFVPSNAHYFNFFGGDTEVLLDRCKIEHGVRNFLNRNPNDEEEYVMTNDDIEKGYKSFISMKHVSEEKNVSMMYI